MPIKLNSSGGGSVTLAVGATAVDYTLTVPSSTSTLLAAANPTTSGLLAHTGRATISTNLAVSGNTSVTGTITGSSTVSDSKGDVRQLPVNSQTGAYVLVASDAGKTISITTGGVTINQNIFSAGDNITIYNNSGSNQTITQGTGVTLRQAGVASTGNRTLAQYGVCTILCVASNVFVISGAGLS